MSGGFSYFLEPRLLLPAAPVIVVAVVVAWLLRTRLGNRSRQIGFLLFLLSVGLIVVVTLLRELHFGFCPACVGGWAGWDRILAGSVDTKDALNVVLFVPPAFLATLLWRAPWRTAGIAALGSLVIESVQPIIGVGVNDLMDLLTNSVGALIGVGLASVVLLIRAAIVDKRLDVARTVSLAVSLLVGAVLLLGGPAVAAAAKQADGVARLQAMFAGTTLTDYQTNRDTTWLPKLEQLWTETGMPTMTSRSAAGVVLERFSWNVYFIDRCVIARWTPTSFETIPLSGFDCTDPLDRHG